MTDKNEKFLQAFSNTRFGYIYIFTCYPSSTTPKRHYNIFKWRNILKPKRKQ